MENASKALLIAGAILLCILIIAIGMFIYNSTQSTITDSLSTLSTQEIEAYNNQFLTYQGIQKGINIKRLIRMIFAMQDENLKGRMYYFIINKFDENKDYEEYVNDYINQNKQSDSSLSPSAQKQKTIDGWTKIMNTIKPNHEYYVSFCYNKKGLIECIILFYDANIDPNKIPIVHLK